MSDVPFIVKKVSSRRRIQVVPIPWAQPAAAAVPYPSYLPPPTFKFKRKVRHLTVVELNVYPATPPTPEQPPTSYQLPKQFRFKTERVRQEVALFNVFFAADITPGISTFAVRAVIDGTGETLEAYIAAHGQSVVSAI